MRLIDKDVIITEIARQKAQWRICKSSETKYRREMLDDISSFLDTLEVKEVDLEKIIGEYLSAYWPNEKELQPFLGHVAKHFFELGMAVSNKTQKGE